MLQTCTLLSMLSNWALLQQLLRKAFAPDTPYNACASLSHGSCVLQKPNRATPAHLEVFHTHEYINFLQTAKPEHITDAQVQHYNVIDDSPVFEGVFKFCQIYAGASIHGAQKLIQDDYDIAINWAGGLHHAKKGEASGAHFTMQILDMTAAPIAAECRCMTPKRYNQG